MHTKPISLAGVQPGSLELYFASSWRPEGFDDVDAINNQTAQITASYDGGPEVEVMLWDSDPGSDTFHDHYPNEEVLLTIDNPAGAQNVVLTFALLTAYNDWWWAVDNIELTGITSGGTQGDFNSNGQLDAADIDELSNAVRTGSTDAKYNLNGDAGVNDADRTYWVENLKKTYFGDANLDGEFSSADFVAVFTVGKYESGNAATWAEGDWNGDAVFTSSDFVTAFSAGGYELGPRAAVSAVPEPASAVLMLLGLGALAARRRR
jgi:hypothetical protein